MSVRIRKGPSGPFVTVLTTDDLPDITEPNDTIAWGNNSVTSSTTTRFLEPWFDDATAPTSRIQWELPLTQPTLLDRLFVVHNSPGGNGSPIVYTLEVNAVPTALSVSVASTSMFGSNLVDAILVDPGSTQILLSLEVTKPVGIGASPTDIMVSMRVSRPPT